MGTYRLSGNTYTDKIDLVDIVLAADMNGVQDELALIEAALFPTGDNTALGIGALDTTPGGSYNSGVGYNALGSATTGSKLNVAIGASALLSATTASNNTIIGTNAGRSIVTGYGNTIIGESAGRLTTGNENVFIGSKAGYNETGSKKLYIDISDTPNPLIYGDFLGNHVKINGTFEVTQGKPITRSYALLLNPATSGDEGMTSDGTYFYWGKDKGDGVDAEIYKINATTGALAATFAGPQHAAGGDYRPDHNTILFGGFGWTYEKSYNQVWEINTTTGAKVRSWDFSADLTGTGVYPAYLGNDKLFVMNIHYGEVNSKNDFYLITINDDGTYTIDESWLDYGDFGKPQDLAYRGGFIYLVGNWKLNDHYKMLHKFQIVGDELINVDTVRFYRAANGDVEGIANHNGSLVMCFQSEHFYTIDSEYQFDDVRITSNVGFYNTPPKSKQTITGARDDGTALASLLTALSTIGLITDSTTAS